MWCGAFLSWFLLLLLFFPFVTLVAATFLFPFLGKRKQKQNSIQSCVTTQQNTK